MKKYRKYWIAVAGGAAQIIVVLDQALQADVIPQSWRPWVVAVVAVATAAGVRHYSNDPLTPESRSDRVN